MAHALFAPAHQLGCDSISLTCHLPRFLCRNLGSLVVRLVLSSDNRGNDIQAKVELGDNLICDFLVRCLALFAQSAQQSHAKTNCQGCTRPELR